MTKADLFPYLGGAALWIAFGVFALQYEVNQHELNHVAIAEYYGCTEPDYRVGVLNGAAWCNEWANTTTSEDIRAMTAAQADLEVSGFAVRSLISAAFLFALAHHLGKVP